MKQILVLLSLLAISNTSFAQITSAGSGDWSNTATWVGGVVPSASSDVIIANGHTVTVDVDASSAGLTTNSGGTLTMGTGGTLHVRGNLLNNGTFTADSRTVEFNGVGLQTINGTPDGSGYVAFFYELTINNSAGVKMLDKIRIWSSLVLSTGQFDLNGKILRLDNALTLTRAGGTMVKNGGGYNLGGSIDVVYTVPCTTGDEFLPTNLGVVTINVGSGNSVTMASSTNAWYGFTLTSGNLVTGVNTLTLGYSGNMGSVNHTSGALVGNFKRWITNTTAANVIFPVGTLSKYRPAVLSFTSAPSVEGTITASYVALDPGTNGVNLSTTPVNDGGYNITKVATDGYWILTSGDGLTGGVYSVDITADGYTGISDYTTLRIVKRADASSNWTVDGSHAAGTGSNAVPIAHRTGLTGFSQFGIGSNTADNPLPVELTSFTASVQNKNIILEWNTATETNTFGFEVERQPLPNPPLLGEGIKGWGRVGFVEGKGTTNGPQRYGFNDVVAEAGKYLYRLKQIDRDGRFVFSKEIEATVVFKPAEHTLRQNYPNPFNPITYLRFAIADWRFVTLKVYDVLGREVATLVNSDLPAGEYSFPFDGKNLSSGVYFYCLRVGNFVQTKQMVLAR